MKKKLPKYYCGAVGLICEYTCYNPLRVDLYSMCAFGCIYCFGNELFSGIFDAQYDWKRHVRCSNIRDVIGLFEHAYGTSRPLSGVMLAIQRRIPIRMSAKTDSFQPMEREKGIALKFLKFVADIGHPIIVSTKSDLLLQDNYYKALTSIDHLLVQETVITTDVRISKMLEPNAPSPGRRLSVLKACKEAGIATTVRMQPLYPKINSGSRMIKTISDCVDAADTILTEEGFVKGTKHASKIDNYIRAYAKRHDVDPNMDAFSKFNIEEAILSTGDAVQSLSGTEAIDYSGNDILKMAFGGLLCSSTWGAFMHLIAKSRCHKLGMRHEVDLPAHTVLCDTYHCCGTYGVKGFESLNGLCTRSWVRETQRLGEIRERDAFRFDALSSSHYMTMKTVWNSTLIDDIIGVKRVKEAGVTKKIVKNYDDMRLVRALSEIGKRQDDVLTDWWKSHDDRASPNHLIFA